MSLHMIGVLATYIAVATTLAAALGGAGVSPSAEPPPPKTTLQGVTVTAAKPSAPNADVRGSIDQFSGAAGDGRIARWAAPVCPLARGLPSGFNGFIEDRIKANATSVGALAGGRRCETNILILFTPSPNALAAALVKEKRIVLTGAGDRSSTGKLDRFVKDEDVARVFRETEVAPATAGGGGAGEAVDMSAALSLSYGYLAGATGTSGGSANQTTGARQFGGGIASRLDGAGNAALERVIIIVDSRRTANLTAGQIADYLSLAALADVREPKTPFQPKTIANLFLAPNDVDALTNWDRAYLKALYAGAGGALNRSIQITRMASYVKQH